MGYYKPHLVRMKKYLLDISFAILSVLFMFKTDYSNLTPTTYFAFFLIAGWIVLILYRIRKEK